MEILGSTGILTGLVDGLPHPGVPRRFLGLGLLHHRQAVLPAQLVGCRPELGILAAALLVLLAVHIRYGIDDEVVVQIFRIILAAYRLLHRCTAVFLDARSSACL